MRWRDGAGLSRAERHCYLRLCKKRDGGGVGGIVNPGCVKMRDWQGGTATLGCAGRWVDTCGMVEIYWMYETV